MSEATEGAPRPVVEGNRAARRARHRAEPARRQLVPQQLGSHLGQHVARTGVVLACAVGLTSAGWPVVDSSAAQPRAAETTGTVDEAPAAAEAPDVVAPDTASVEAQAVLAAVPAPPPTPEEIAGPGAVDVAGLLLSRPAAGEVTSRFGHRTHPVYGTGRMHTGTDFSAADGDIRAAADGVVTQAGHAGGYGLMTTVEHTAPDGSTIETRYAHQSRIDVSVGETVERGQVIGRIGSTGVSTGPHLHFEVLDDGVHRDPQG